MNMNNVPTTYLGIMYTKVLLGCIIYIYIKYVVPSLYIIVLICTYVQCIYQGSK